MGIIKKMELSANTSTADSHGVSLRYQSLGDADAPGVLLIMGVSAPMTRWPRRLCDVIVAAGYRVVRFDNRDSGGSRKFDELGAPDRRFGDNQSPPPYPLTALSDDAIALLDHLGIAAAHIVGVSMGGAIAQDIAARYPGRTLSLTSIMSTSGGRDLPPPSARVRELFAQAPKANEFEQHEDRVRALLISAEAGRSPGFPSSTDGDLARAEQEARGGFTLAGRARQAAALFAAGDRRDQLAAISAATTVIHGDADELFPLEHGRDTARLINGAVLKIVPGLGHDLPEAAATELATLIIEAVERAGNSQPR